jgi:hypothetical protein
MTRSGRRDQVVVMNALEQNIMEALAGRPCVDTDELSVASRRDRPERDAIGLDEMRVAG